MDTFINLNNGITLHLDLDGDRFLGIGRVTYRGRELRSGQMPWNLYTESEGRDHGVRFEEFRLKEVKQDGERVELVLSSKAKPLPRIQEADAMGEARIKNRRVDQPEAIFIWVFQAITETVYENSWDGLAMHIRYECPRYPINWVLEQATWELGGEATDAVLIQQDVSAMDLEKVVAPSDAFSTIERFFAEDGWGGNYPMDMLPRAAGASICDFQAKGDLALCLFSEKPGLTRARLDKFADEAVIHYLDRAYFPLAENAVVQERKLLVHQAPAKLERHAIRNLWLDCFTEVRRRIYATYEFELEVPEPCTGGHLWDEDLEVWKDRWPEPLEQDLPEYARLGYKQVFMHGVWESITSDPNPPAKGNICCPYSFRFAECFGGSERIKLLNDRATENGLRLMQWFSFHLSEHAPLWKAHPDWVIKEANGDPWDGNYRILWSGRMRSDYGEHFKKEIMQVMDDTGIAGIFWDSYQNLGVTCVDWGAPDKAPQADEIFRLQGELQRKGFRQRVEVITIFGVSQVAIFGFANDVFRRRLWNDFVDKDHAFALLDCSPAFFTDQQVAHPDRLSPEKYFWMVGHRVVPGLDSDPWERGEQNKTRLPGGADAEAYARVNHCYHTVLPYMQRLRLQPNGTHVLWLDEDDTPAVIWAFQDTEIRDIETVVDVEGGAVTEEDGSVSLKKGKVYGLLPEVNWVERFARESNLEPA